jgi:hypothetical protein
MKYILTLGRLNALIQKKPYHIPDFVHIIRTQMR